jgi:myosin heavy subunit
MLSPQLQLSVSNPHWIVLPPHKRRWNFCIRHFAADVTYTVTEDNLWVQRNNDAVPSGLAQMLQESNHAILYHTPKDNTEELLKGLERSPEDCSCANDVIRGIGSALSDLTATPESDPSKKSSGKGNGQLVKSTVSSMFISSMERLTMRLDATNCSFIRCIKPSMALTDGLFDRPFVAAQLRYLGILQTCEVCCQTYMSLKFIMCVLAFNVIIDSLCHIKNLCSMN